MSIVEVTVSVVAPHCIHTHNIVLAQATNHPLPPDEAHPGLMDAETTAEATRSGGGR